MLTSVVLALVWQGGGLPRPTGRNGYEEYMQAAEILKAPGASLLLTWQPGMKPRPRDPEDPDDKGPSAAEVAEYARLNSMTPLEVRREALRRFGRALTLVAQGNTKPVFDPRQNVQVATAFPELAIFRSVSRLGVAASTVYAADGRTDLATRTLLDQLTFADNFSRGVMIANLVATASSAIAIRSFEELFPRMSLRDAEMVSTAINGLLARSPSAIDTLIAEAGYMRSAVREAISAKPSDVVSLGSGDEEAPDPTTKRMMEEFAKLTRAGRQALLRTVDLRLQERLQRRVRALKGPEKGWIPSLSEQAEADGGKPETLADYLVSVLDGGTALQFVQVNLRTRAQLRLIALYASATAYRWENGRWPSKIDALDPLSGEPFVYEVRADGTIRIASKGTKETGEIGLVYRAPKPVEEAKP